MKRAYNFNAGPAALPAEVLTQAQEELLDFQGTGMSVMELSHRSKAYEAVHEETKALLREHYRLPDEYDILFLQGGASTQFAMLPMNFLKAGKLGAYALTGSWSEKALKEAKLAGETAVIASGKEGGYRAIPDPQLSIPHDAAYVHLTTNNTIYGTQWQDIPDTGKTPLFADMSSDILSRELPVERFSLIYAGAQKNMGPSGVTVVILKKELLEDIPDGLPTMLDYRTHAEKKSLYNTPPTFSIYMMNLILKWIKRNGGLAGVEQTNRKKSAMIYDAIDGSSGFYTGHADKNSRSLMNITFTLPDETLTEAFLQEAKELGFSGLNGHRSIGGCRASAYNAVSMEACEALSDFMVGFQRRHQ
ncbi:3-phosphoserine/phosphohydroxythreonine transaminase [Bacillus marinisedimentorum]|uniref:3-phosphoserine/phosphohydroxythreonine transaminase n=1 Tax=Bacillus marinisedimentorum TaxID=1821260 RepID=UPI0007DFF7E8|nr:3-phosphoserine/phosphohydroxythreonine transaminase [Bacillus marinisedimentorum]